MDRGLQQRECNYTESEIIRRLWHSIKQRRHEVPNHRQVKVRCQPVKSCYRCRLCVNCHGRRRLSNLHGCSVHPNPKFGSLQRQERAARAYILPLRTMSLLTSSLTTMLQGASARIEPRAARFLRRSSNNLFDSVEAYNNGQMGMQMYSASGAPNNNIVRNSYFHDNNKKCQWRRI